MSIGGMGVIVKITINAVLTAIASVEDVDYPKFKKFIDEITAHDSPGGYYQAASTGKRRVEPFPMTLIWDPASASHTAMLAAFDSDAAVSMSIQDPSGAEVISFSALVEEVERIDKQDKAMRAKVLIHPSGQPTIV